MADPACPHLDQCRDELHALCTEMRDELRVARLVDAMRPYLPSAAPVARTVFIPAQRTAPPVVTEREIRDARHLYQEGHRP